MNIAVVTGASSGIGKEYVKAIAEMYPSLDEIWILARRKDRLEMLANEIISPNCRAVQCDITNESDIEHYKNLLNETQANVKILVNNAGFGKLGYFEDIDVVSTAGMTRLNCEALTVITSITLPHMKENAQIINISSIASFVPNARMAVYCSTKAFVTSFSKALREELKRKKINVLAVCPGPMDTEFLPVANIEPGTSRTFDTLPRVKPAEVAKKSLVAARKKRAVYTNHFFYKFYRILSKILPHSILMKISAT